MFASNFKQRISIRKVKEIGLEESRTMQKLKNHCIRLGEDICCRMPLDVDLPEGYKIIIKPNTTNDPNYVKKPVLVNYKKHISISSPLTRNMALYFTKDVADGLLDKFEVFFEEFNKSKPQTESFCNF